MWSQNMYFSKFSWGACPQTPLAKACFACWVWQLSITNSNLSPPNFFLLPPPLHLISINVDCNLYIVIIRIIKFMLAITETTSYHFCMPSSYITSSTCTHYPMYTWETCQKYIYGANYITHYTFLKFFIPYFTILHATSDWKCFWLL